MLVSHGAIKSSLRRLIARCREVNRAQFLVGIFLRKARRRKSKCCSNCCSACDGRGDQRFTHNSPLHRRLMACLLTVLASIGAYADGLNVRECPSRSFAPNLPGSAICQLSRPSSKCLTERDELRRELRRAFVSRLEIDAKIAAHGLEQLGVAILPPTIS
jgi:hypothetical protein